MDAAQISRRLTTIWATPRTLWGELATVDHKKIGRRYLVTATLFLIVGGIEALVMRLQLAQSDLRLLDPETYNQIFTMHGITMIFWYAAPILSGFGNYLLPLMIGARDMAFPRLNAFSYWTFLFSGLFLYASVLIGQAPHGGWFAYVPYTNGRYSPGLHMDFYALSLLFLTLSSTVGAINFIGTVGRLRAPGMAVSKMPLVTFSSVTTSALAITSLPALTVACTMLYLDRRWGTHFFDVAQGGSPLLWQHVFWFFGHPWVYIVFLPATGMISMMLPGLTRRPIVGYPYIAVATMLTGVVGMGVWVHHMFATGMNQVSMSLFSAASLTISLFSTVQVFAWIATLWTGRPVMITALRFALGFIAVFVLGGLSGVVTAVIPFDWQLTDTYFVVAHLHYVLVGANVFPVMAATYYWFPKITGRMLDERLGRASFWLMFIGFNAAFFPMHVTGLEGMPRRIYTYPPEMGWDDLNLLVSAGAFLLAIGILVSVVNIYRSLRRGARASANPWNAPGLEWETASPPAAYGSVHIPTVVSRYSGWDGHDSQHDPTNSRTLDQGRLVFATSWLDAVPVAIARMPEDTILPLLVAMAVTGVFSALLLKLVWIAVGFAVVALFFTFLWLWPEPDRMARGRPASVRPLGTLNWDERRGTWAMVMFVIGEAMLFAVLFFAYAYLSRQESTWPPDPPPKIALPVVAIAVLFAGSVVLEIARRLLRHGLTALARAGAGLTALLGIAFLVIEAIEHRDHLQALKPTSNAYGSIFYLITGVHAAHAVLGVLMLLFVLLLPELEPTSRSPHRPLRNTALYWHFLTASWIVVVAVLYLFPNYQVS